MATSPVRRRLPKSPTKSQSQSLALPEDETHPTSKPIHATAPSSANKPPTIMAIALKLMSSTAGRDKLYRTIQYVSRLVGSFLEIERLLVLSGAVGQGRKLFRVGKPLEHAQTIWTSLLEEEGEVAVRAGKGLKALGYGGWLLLDMLQWLQAVKLINLNPESLSWINYYAPRFWLLGLLASLFANGYRARQKVMAGNADLQKETYEGLQDAIDLVIPASQAGMVSLSPTAVGLAGSITSLMGLYSLLK